MGFLALTVVVVTLVVLNQGETKRHRQVSGQRTAVAAGLAAWVDEHGGTVIDVDDRAERTRLRAEVGPAGAVAVVAARARVAGRPVTVLSWCQTESESPPTTGTVAAAVLSTSPPPLKVQPRVFVRRSRPAFDRLYAVKRGREHADRLLGAPERELLVRLPDPGQVGAVVALEVADGVLTLRTAVEAETAVAVRALADAAVALATAVDAAAAA